MEESGKKAHTNAARSSQLELSVRVFVVFFISTGFFFLLFDSFTPITTMHFLPIVRQKKSPSTSSKEWRILWHNIPSYLVNSFNYAKSKKCQKYPNCIFSMDGRDLNKSDVVLFTQAFMAGVPPPKRPQQIFIFNSMESPAFMHPPSPNWDDKLDWLMSYRRHSDIHRPYGTLVKRETPLVKNYTDVFKKKKGFGVWMSGHCPVPSRRRDYIRELNKYVKVDMFGTCGDRVCLKRSPFLSECLRNFSRDYKFYFAFENNICNDYSTEKLYNLYFGNLDVIPVINGPRSAKEYLPKGTFISALDFPSPKALAEKLKEIAADENVFTQYLKEKDKYYEIGIHEVFLNSMCKICSILDETNGKPQLPNGTIWQRFFSNGGC